MGRKGGAKKGGGGMKGFLKQTQTAKKTTQESSSSSSSSSEEGERLEKGKASVKEPSQEAPPDLDSETKAQLRERHKKELNAAKKEAAKLGKKKKQEAAAMVEIVRERHERESKQHKEHTGESPDSDSEKDEKDRTRANGNVTVETNVEPSAPIGKKSKAQKRREKEAQREEERETRIQEGIEKMGVTERETEEEILKEKLAAIDCTIYEIRPDGHCLYNAIHDQLANLTDVPLNVSCEELRAATADELRSNADLYMPFYVPDDPSAERMLSFLQHCDKVQSTAEWGGELEIQALSQRLERKMVIYSVSLGKKVIGDQFYGDPIRLCFMQHAYQLGAHYNSVRTVQ